MLYIPYEKMSVEWVDSGEPKFVLTLPWLCMDVSVTTEDEQWVRDATANLHFTPENENVQKFIEEWKHYPVFYTRPRQPEEFEGYDLQNCPDIDVDPSTPSRLLETFGCPISESLKEDIPSEWIWDQEQILSKTRITGTDLYDPVSLVRYLTCYRLDWESGNWVGQDGLGNFLEILLGKDEEQFFQAIGCISRQAWQVMTEYSPSMKLALPHFTKGKKALAAYIAEEIGHNKFMDQVFKELGLEKDAFSVTGATRWLLDAYKRAAVLSPLAFSAMVGLFEASYYEEEEPIAEVIKHSSRPKAARGWELHRKVNEDYRHCDVSVGFASHLGPQSRSHTLLMLGLYELTLNALDRMEQRLAKSFGIDIPDYGFKGIQPASTFHASSGGLSPLMTAA